MTAPVPSKHLSKSSSVQGVALRVTKLNADGTAMTGADTSYTMNRFVTATFTPVYNGANNIQQQLANGNFAVTYQTSDIFQNITAAIQIAGPDFEFNQIAVGGDLIVENDGTVVGWRPTATGEVDQPNGVALEIWSYAIEGARQSVVRPFYHWVLPRVYLHPADDKVLQNDVLAWNVAGWGNENPNFAGTGVSGTTRWPYPTDRPYQYARVASAPIGVNGYQVV